MRNLTEADVKTLHEIMQPLNIIRLSCGNIRARIVKCECEDTDYLIGKMMRIEEQIVRASKLLHELKERSEGASSPHTDPL